MKYIWIWFVFPIIVAQDQIVSIRFWGSRRALVEVGQTAAFVFSVGDFGALDRVEWNRTTNHNNIRDQLTVMQYVRWKGLTTNDPWLSRNVRASIQQAESTITVEFPPLMYTDEGTFQMDTFMLNGSWSRSYLDIRVTSPVESINMTIEPDLTLYQGNADITVTCMGNVGRPAAMLEVVKTSTLGGTQFYRMSDLGLQSKLTPAENGTQYAVLTFKHVLQEGDNFMKIGCRANPHPIARQVYTSVMSGTKFITVNVNIRWRCFAIAGLFFVCFI